MEETRLTTITVGKKAAQAAKIHAAIKGETLKDLTEKAIYKYIEETTTTTNTTTAHTTNTNTETGK